MAKLFLLLLSGLVAQLSFGQVLKGQLTNESGDGIPFATIKVQSGSSATTSNSQGHFELNLRTGTHVITFSGEGYVSRTDTVVINRGTLEYPVTMAVDAQILEETVINAKSRKDLGKEIMKQVIDKRSYFQDQLSKYSCTTYCLTSLDKEVMDSIVKDSVVAIEKTSVTEWVETSYYEASNRYKDVYEGFTDFTEEFAVQSGRGAQISVNVGSGNQDIQPINNIQTDPYVFVNSYKDADMNLFDNIINAPGLSQRPLISPLANNAFLYYNFYLQTSFYENNLQKIYEIRVVPRFHEEALFEGTLLIRDESWELVSYNLSVNKGALTYFKEMHVTGDYVKTGERLVPLHREFTYVIKEGREKIFGNIRLAHTNHQFEFDDSPRKFWLETAVYKPEAFDRDSSYWNAIRPFPLKPDELKYMARQDSIQHYHESEEYLKKQDSIYNNLTIWNFVLTSVGFRNTFKKQELYIGGLITQVVPFGVGGYRHRLNATYTKEFKNGKQLELSPLVDYGFRNKDLKGELGVGYMYNPMRFSRLYVNAGDVYDFVSNYQSVQGTFGPANRVRNQKLEVSHRHEVVNGLYFKAGFFYSNRSSLDHVEYPEWVNAFGFFSKPTPFEGYKIFMTDFELSYHFRQKYMLRKDRKIIVGDQWPVLSLQYKKGIPRLFGGQANYDFMELRLTDEINFNAVGKSEFRFVSGGFLRKKDLRLIEHKYFRTSDRGFFSNPMLSLQLLDTALNTTNSYMQLNYIHHFNGFFLNKIWLINRLKLEETVGGSFLGIPDAHFAQVEFYAGLERAFRIRKDRFKLGIYAVTADSSFDKANIHFKFGITFYNSFYKKWEYAF